eukprot:CAMPEP_0172734320 /NCGR_PEP_ID=MMETSP1074-20121228/109552_1 /TAXON_ID=2916 /ORGANISM="Ceratium fusus, Strain PA161109" /LENGTH=92 /DNA_ID=CAMNT_0013563059 /DNA_START=280 /DNA_END=555 /DNA_ORIENTATION=-
MKPVAGRVHFPWGKKVQLLLITAFTEVLCWRRTWTKLGVQIYNTAMNRNIAGNVKGDAIGVNVGFRMQRKEPVSKYLGPVQNDVAAAAAAAA